MQMCIYSLCLYYIMVSGFDWVKLLLVLTGLSEVHNGVEKERFH
jgi:hypothetical protein